MHKESSGSGSNMVRGNSSGSTRGVVLAARIVSKTPCSTYNQRELPVCKSNFTGQDLYFVTGNKTCTNVTMQHAHLVWMCAFAEQYDHIVWIHSKGACSDALLLFPSHEKSPTPTHTNLVNFTGGKTASRSHGGARKEHTRTQQRTGQHD